ncbi:MAG: peptidoglycan DD-metalloendopeptidase family protein [Oscillospiraceae bacterium]|nr:peptidoglycan DD-metalloendopeptidase family protein [Oscillospiraceae bacterium]
MALSDNKNTLTADPSDRSDEIKEHTADEMSTPSVGERSVSAADKNRFNWFGTTAKCGELLFDALKTLAKYFAYGILWLIAAFLRGWARVSKQFKKLFKKAAEVVAMPFKRYKMALKMDGAEISKAKREKGALGGAAAGAKVAGRVIFGKRGLIVSIANWVLPVVSCIFLFNIISYANSQTYALKLTVNGDFIGYINDETVFTSAEKMVQKRINYTGSRTEIITFEPSYEVQSIGYGDTLNVYQTADKMLELMGGDIKKGYGLYIGDAYFGTLEEHGKVDRVLENLLDQYRTENPKESVEFEKDITFIDGKYLADSFVDEDNMISTLTSFKQVSTYHTVEASNVPAAVAEEIGMTVDALDELNPGFSEKEAIYAGERVSIIQDVPFLSVKITREEHYNEPVEYDTEYFDDNDRYQGDQKIRTEGKNGEQAVVANVSYVNGIEVSRTILSTVITTEPVTQVVQVGVKERPADAGPERTVPEGQFYWPVGGYNGGLISQMPNIHGGLSYHKGLDIAAAYGTPVYAGDSGTVIAFGFSVPAKWNYGMGNYIKIQHDNGLVTIYQHLSAVSSDIHVGKRVTMGEHIGNVGSTGNSTGNHLHFEVQYNGVVQDPLAYLPEHARQPGCRYY